MMKMKNMMKYVTLSDLCSTIRNNIHKIPHDIDAVLGVPRSGMIAASIISEFLNVPLGDVNSFSQFIKPSGGDRLKLFGQTDYKRILVVDDTTFSGKSMRETKEKLNEYKNKFKDVEFIYAVAYLEGDDGQKEIDFYLEDMRHKDEGWGNICLYEWCLFNHYPHVMAKIMWDLDGVFCIDPEQDADEEKYIEYIKNAPVLFTPKVKLNKILTYRCDKYREITKEWLAKNGIHYNLLGMVPAQNYMERHMIAPSSAAYKGEIYKVDDAQLFIESDNKQAQEIARISGKPCLCVSTNKLYQ